MCRGLKNKMQLWDEGIEQEFLSKKQFGNPLKNRDDGEFIMTQSLTSSLGVIIQSREHRRSGDQHAARCASTILIFDRGFSLPNLLLNAAELSGQLFVCLATWTRRDDEDGVLSGCRSRVFLSFRSVLVR